MSDQGRLAILALCKNALFLHPCSGFLSDRLNLRYFLTVGMLGKKTMIVSPLQN